MKVFFDTNFYVAEALLGRAAQDMADAVLAARWRVYVCRYLLDELERVLVVELGFKPTTGADCPAFHFTPLLVRGGNFVGNRAG